MTMVELYILILTSKFYIPEFAQDPFILKQCQSHCSDTISFTCLKETKEVVTVAVSVPHVCHLKFVVDVLVSVSAIYLFILNCNCL